MIDLTVPEIRRKLQEADAAAFAVLERSLVADTRKGVRAAVEVARRRLEAEAAEEARLAGMYAFERWSSGSMRWDAGPWRGLWPWGAWCWMRTTPSPGSTTPSR